MTDSDQKPQSAPGKEHKSKWETQKEKLKARFSILTDEDFEHEEGKRDEMMDKLQQKIGKTKAELAEIISTL